MQGRICRDAGTYSKRARRGHVVLSSMSAMSALACVVGAVHLAAAAWLFVQLVRDQAAFPLHGSLALLFVILGGWFAVAGYRTLRRTEREPIVIPPARRRYWRWCGICFVACYTLTLAIGVPSWAGYLFWGLLAICHWCVWVIISCPPVCTRYFQRLVRTRPARTAGWALYLFLMVPLAGELGLRLYAMATDDLVAVRYVTSVLKLPPGGERQGRLVNSQGYWDDEFHTRVLHAGLRVAAVGDESVLCGDAESNFLAQVERTLPGVDVLNFGVPQASPREYASQLESAVAPCRPDVVLVFFSVGTDVTESPSLPSAFDWRSLHLVQRSLDFGRHVPPEVETGCEIDCVAESDALDWDLTVAQLQVCRVPVQEQLQDRWRETFEHLDNVIGQCQADGVEPMLVVVPCEFQVDERLCEILCRRAGCRRADQIDIDLPQRRLAAYAKDRRLPLLDLLPHLRASNHPTFSGDAPHFNDHGNSLTADVLCDWLETQYSGTLLAGGS